MLGGATRILIIDDDPKSSPSGSSAQDTGSSDPGVPNWPAETQIAAPDSARPVVHEYQIPTPLPGDLETIRDARAELADNAHPDPSTVRELIARIEELLHRTRHLPAAASPGWAGTIQFGSVLLEPATQTVLRAGQPVRLTHTEFRLLLALIRRRGAIASRIELLREIWGAGAAVSRRAVDTHIARLRRKLEDDPANPRHILTALAWGYRFRP
ncbi:MAG: winged helix-turn-helix domain-containing protein [Gemmatimonadales bacterium]